MVPIVGMVWGAASGDQGGQDIAPHESRLIYCLLVKIWGHLHRCQLGVAPEFSRSDPKGSLSCSLAPPPSFSKSVLGEI